MFNLCSNNYQLLVVGGNNLGKDPKRHCLLPINLLDVMLTIHSHFYMDLRFV